MQHEGTIIRRLKMKVRLSLISAALLFITTAVSLPQTRDYQQLSKNRATQAGADTIAVDVHVDLSQRKGKLKPVWRFFGADEPNFAYMKDGQKLLGELGQLRPGTVYFRTHNLLTTGDGTPALKWGSTNVYTEDAQGKPVYDWTIVDRIFDTYLQRGLKPYVQIGFMPKALSLKPDPYQHHWTPTAKYDEIYTGWSYPPNDYKKWGELVYQWARHCVGRYGRREVESWYWETWNEANIGYWRGSPEEFRKLHDYAVDAVRRALPTARVGGPDTAGSGGQFTRDFVEHNLRGTNYATGQTGTPFDFISFHAKGAPRFVNGHVQMGIANQLRTVDQGFSLIASYPELKDKPIVIGESDPDGCAACQGSQLGYRNSTMYSAYTAASFTRVYDLADKHGVNLEGVLTWAFEFENQPYFAGFRVLATNGIDLPVLNVFRMFAKMKGDRVPVESNGALALDSIVKNGVREQPDVSGFASVDDNRLYLLMWHYHDDDLPGADAAVKLTLNGLQPRVKRLQLDEYRIDANHSNAFTAWQKMGSPANPSPQQYGQLQKAGELAKLAAPANVQVAKGVASINLLLSRQAVSLLVLRWE
jgi:xylan 1,4-beta-xylosidase